MMYIKKRIVQSIAVVFLLLSMVSCSFVGCLTGNGTLTADITATEVIVKEGVGQVVSLCQSDVAEYIAAMKAVTIEGDDYCFNDEAGAGVSVKDYWTENTNVSGGNAVKLTWTASAAPYEIKLSENEDLSEARTFVTNDNSLSITNLYMATTYYWSVTDGNGKERKLNSFETADTVRTMFTGYVNNVRDLGGRMTSSGKRVKQGVIYRGAEMNLQTYTDENGAKHVINLRSLELDLMLNQLNIKNEIDFRTDAETRSMKSSPLGEGVNYYREPISSYTGMFCKHTDGSDNNEMRVMYQNILRTLATASEDNVIYLHCWGGADRTGTISFLINGLLGVSYTDLLIDFELTTFSNNFRSREDNPDYYNYFNSMVTQLKEDYQHSDDESISIVIERYMKECLYLTDADITALKTNLLED